MGLAPCVAARALGTLILPRVAGRAGLAMPRLTGLSVFLNVKNVEKSAAFYEGLGFKRTLEFPDMGVIGYGLGAATFLIGGNDGSDPEVAKWLAGKEWGVGTLLMPAVDDVDEVHRLALKLGAVVEAPPTDHEWGSRTVRILDPDGYVLEFDQALRPPPKPRPKARKAVKAKKAARKGSAAKGAGKAAKSSRRRR
jgi:catechol 2,3-dioxygenase-like lactoylglutathione lyase family enzyme